jgi:hypothetical protein
MRRTFLASGSGIFFWSTQSLGFSSEGSSIPLGGMTEGEKSSSILPFTFSSPFTWMEKVLLGLKKGVRRKVEEQARQLLTKR